MKYVKFVLSCLVVLGILAVVLIDSKAYSKTRSTRLESNTTTNEIIEETTAQTEEIIITTVPQETTVDMTDEIPTDDNTLCIGESFDDQGWAAEGFLRYTVTNARLVDSLPDANYVEGFAYEEFLLLVEGEGWIEQDLPVYINEDLSIKEGNYLIFVDVTIENMGARCDTRPMGKYEDPYIFRSDCLFLINTDIQDPLSDVAYVNLNTCYYSQMYDHPELPDNHATYRLEPGETISFTVAYHLDAGIAQLAGHPVDIAKFCVTTLPQKCGQRVNLGLTGTITGN